MKVLWDLAWTALSFVLPITNVENTEGASLGQKITRLSHTDLKVLMGHLNEITK